MSNFRLFDDLVDNMKQLHNQYLNTIMRSSKKDEEMITSSQNSNRSSIIMRRHSRSLFSYLIKEQRLMFLLIGVLIASMIFILSPISPLIIRPPYPTTMPRLISGVVSHNQLPRNNRPAGAGNNMAGRVPIGIGSSRKKRIVVTGGAGFVGSHLVDKLIARGDEVIVIDNFFTGRKENIAHHLGNPRFELIRHDIIEPILLEVDQVYHLACPASPVHYKYNPIKTIKTSVLGTINMLGLAKRTGARFLLTSTSEVYGEPLDQHPQKETYWGHVNPIGERSCYDEGKRVAETLTMDYHREGGLEVRIARVFNTYGPRMCLDDGRVVSNLVAQAIRRRPMTVYGNGKQTRSLQYVSDLVDGLVVLMESEHVGPFNLGNPGEFVTMLELAEVVKEAVDPTAARVEFQLPIGADDVARMRTRPDISKAKELLNWEPKITLRQGLPLMVTEFRSRILNEDRDRPLNVGARDAFDLATNKTSNETSSVPISYGGKIDGEEDFFEENIA
ncbi:UDP-glucuronic acid decarboxylase 1 [Dionaea muscipula]